MDFNEVHMTLTYPTITGQTQADTVYVRGLTVMGTVLAEGTPLAGHARGHDIEGALQTQDPSPPQYMDQVARRHGGEGRRHPGRDSES